MQDKIQQVRNKVIELVAFANQHYSTTLPAVAVTFDLKGRSAGQARLQKGIYQLRFNLEMMRGSGWDHIIKDTVPHEVAHLVCFNKPSLGRNHDWGWRSVCVKLGGSGERCHTEEVVFGKGRTFEYTSHSGRTIKLSEIRHNKIQQGQIYTFRNAGKVDRHCAHRVVGIGGRVLQTTTPAATTVHTPAAISSIPKEHIVLGVGSKADQVRARIRQAKQNGEDLYAVVNWAVANLGMTRALATTYAKNNWSKG